MTASPTAAPLRGGRPKLLSPFSSLSFRALLEFGDQGYTMEPGRRQPPHHPHHGPVINFPVAAHINTGLGAAACLGDCLHLRDQVIDRNFAILQENLAFVVDREGERLLVLLEALGLTL